MIDTKVEVKPLVPDIEDYLFSGFKLAKEAWMNSRPFFKGSIEDIIKNDVPVADFVKIPLVMTIPNFVREVIVSPRDHIVWSSTTRANPLHEAWPVYRPDLYDYASLAESLLKLKETGARQDEFRMVLPIGYCGIFSVNMSFRTIVKLYSFLIKLYFNTSITAFHETAVGIRNVFIGNKELDKLFCVATSNYEKCNFLPEFNIQESNYYYNKFSRVGSFISWTGETSLGLRTHIIRHRSVQISDNLLEIYSILKKLLPLTNLNYKVKLQATATKEIWDHVIGTRNCFIAQASLWQPIVNQYTEFIKNNHEKEYRGPLPCDSEGHCPYSTDNDLRISRKDPNPPCPIYLNINKITVDEEMEKEMLSYGDSRASWWRELYKRT